MATREEHIITLRDRFSGPLKKAQAATKRLTASVQKLNRVGKGLVLGVTLPITLLAGAAIKAASRFEETNAKFQTVFRDISSAAEASAKDLRENFGLSREASKDLLAGTGDLLTGFGFSQKAALDLSTEVNKLAVDLASFTNFSGGAEGASAALTKALLGERESVKSLGISILESDVKARVLLNTQRGLTFESNRQAKAFATLQIAQEQSKNAIGDFARTSGSFANQMRIAKGRLDDVAVQLGTIMLPIATKAIGVVVRLADAFQKLSPGVKKAIVVVALIVAAIGPLLLILGQIIIIAPAVGAAFTIMTGPIGAIVVGIAALIALITAMIVKWDEWGAALSLILGPLGFIISLIMSFRRNWDALLNAFKFGGIGEGFKKLGAIILDSVLMPIEQLVGIVAKLTGVEIFKKAASNLRKFREKLGVKTAENVLGGSALKRDIVVPGAGGGIAGAGVPGAGGAGGGGISAGLSEVRAGAPKTFNINIDKLVEKFEVNTQTIQESFARVKDDMTKAILEALNDSQVIAR